MLGGTSQEGIATLKFRGNKLQNYVCTCKRLMTESMRHIEKIAPIMRLSRLFTRAAACLVMAIALGGCSTTSAVRVVGTAVNLALESAGLKKSGDSNSSYEVPLHITADKLLNTIGNDQSLSLVMKIYLLRSPQSFETLTYQQVNASDAGKEALGNDLVAIREVTLLPGMSYDLPQTVPGDVTAIGVIGLYHAPADNRWRLSFNAQASSDDGIKVVAHACSLTVDEGTLTPTFSAQSASMSTNAQCNG
jgi:type VI secretion system protein VasD